MNPELRQLLTEFDAGIARLREILDRAEARFAAVEDAAPTDPHAGHPTLPGIDAADSSDPTLRVLPWGDLPTPPPAPAGKVWVYRGTFQSIHVFADNREVRFAGLSGWHLTISFSGPSHHIELVDSTL